VNGGNFGAADLYLAACRSAKRSVQANSLRKSLENVSFEPKIQLNFLQQGSASVSGSPAGTEL